MLKFSVCIVRALYKIDRRLKSSQLIHLVSTVWCSNRLFGAVECLITLVWDGREVNRELKWRLKVQIG